MLVYIPSPLRSYTGQADTVTAAGATVSAVLEHLNEIYPGMRFRIVDEQDRLRRHIKIFVNAEAVDDLSTPIGPDDRIHIVCALSGG
jgi:molybdopterin converting factor small subunit